MQQKIHTKWKVFTTFCLALCLLLSGCGGQEADQRFWQQPALHAYRAEIALDEQNKTLTGTLQIRYTNPTGQVLSTAPLMVYPNAYETLETAPFAKDELGKAYPGGFSAGGIAVDNVTVDGAPAQTELNNQDHTRLDIALPQPVQAGQSVEIALHYTVQLPHCLGRFGYGEKTWNLCNFLPVACVWNGQAFVSHPYGAVGDPFVSDCGDYEVTLDVPEGMQVAHTGTARETRTENGRTTLSIQAKQVRDFAAVCSRSFSVETYHVKSGGRRVTVRSFYDESCEEGGKLAGQAAKQAIEVFGEMYGAYPYANFNAVQTDFFIGGMEYPGLVLLDQSLYQGMGMLDLERVTVHETAHQWWYGVVGSDQVTEPWLDEALTDYSTLLYMGQAKGEKEEQAFYDTYVTLLSDIMAPMYDRDQVPATVGSATTAFPNNGVYSLVVYTEGTKMLRELETMIGRETMIEALSSYAHKYAGKQATAENLIQTLEEVSGQNVRMVFEKYL